MKNLVLSYNTGRRKFKIYCAALYKVIIMIQLGNRSKYIYTDNISKFVNNNLGYYSQQYHWSTDLVKIPTENVRLTIYYYLAILNMYMILK